MSYYKMMKKINEKVAAAKSSKKPSFSGSGLLARTSLPAGSLKGSSTDVSDEIAEYISAIRKQKEEIINGK